MPAAIAVLVSGTATKHTMLPVGLAYALGISAIIFADVVTEWILDDLFWVTNDDLRMMVARVWAGCGILGAVSGAFLAVLSQRMYNRRILRVRNASDVHHQLDKTSP